MANVSSTPKFSGMKYRVVNELGEGAGSKIFLISDKAGGGKRYALKIIRKQEPEDDIYIQQARNEYEASQKLNHPAIAKVYDFRQKKSWFKVTGAELLMEFVDGKSLDEVEAPELDQLILIFAKVASAIAHMHRRGVFHGDLKPHNIMLSKNGQVKLIDFGTAWIRGQDSNRAAGTPQYMAPETAVEKTVNAKTDIYNFGATMYRLFTGRFAQQGLPTSGSDRKITLPSKLNPRLPADLNLLIVACLQSDPSKRPADMVEVRDQLAKIAKAKGLEDEDIRGADEE
ncbi:Serine/threonine-protein kinase PrkC [Aquisphaera giovannonii]|uniref:Serine/threonine-protein kinase PrkC n=1 Tax=Aquisphaera giovannonii TaxID=406548 RepID=A0A5B9W916_9BACT|nr:serine/threonine-protein kinase [Aquisphaera giovannonii]QEH36897.1 Serine/threonine-protein kinase PrkC [Aquisphaera giovannonii]